jgi:Flp pilus assembly protein TadD
VDEEARNIGDADRALAMLSKAEYLSPEDEAIFVKKSDVYLAMGDIRAALDCARHAHRLKPNATPLKHKVAALADCRGCIFAENGDLVRALACFDEAIALDARSPPYWIHRALLHLERGAFSKTLSDLDAYLEIEQEEADAFILRGKLLWKLGMADKATRDIGKPFC